jgi:hypothetical protein
MKMNASQKLWFYKQAYKSAVKRHRSTKALFKAYVKARAECIQKGTKHD